MRGHAVGCSSAVGEDPVLESTGVLDGCEATSWLPLDGSDPLLEDMEQCPAREHPLMRCLTRILLPEKEDGWGVKKLQPGIEAAAENG